MDGNGRWARKRGLPKIAGHRAGAKSVDEITQAAASSGVKVLTLYAFSTENWKRPKEEVNALFGLLEDYLVKEVSRLNKNNIRLSVIGNISQLPRSTQDRIADAIEATKGNTGMVLNIALNYGSRREIVDAVRAICEDVKRGALRSEDITEELFSKHLHTAGLPDPDLLIRTSGEFRISNFLLWQVSYAELYITEKLWPDFRKGDFKKALTEYQRRERRFGG